MRVVDTSAWIEWLVSSQTGAPVTPAIPLPEDWLVPTIVQLELVKWLTRELGEDVADQVLAFTQTCNLAPLDTTLAVLAADMCRHHKLATADAIIYATAVAYRADLLTCDAHFDGLPGVLFVAKIPTQRPP